MIAVRIILPPLVLFFAWRRVGTRGLIRGFHLRRTMARTSRLIDQANASADREDWAGFDRILPKIASQIARSRRLLPAEGDAS